MESLDLSVFNGTCQFEDSEYQRSSSRPPFRISGSAWNRLRDALALGDLVVGGAYLVMTSTRQNDLCEQDGRKDVNIIQRL